MELPLTLQGQQFLLAALMGAAFGLLYDILRGLRRVARWATHLLDVLFVLSFLFGSLLFALWIGNGEYRVFMLPGTLLGMVLYFSTLSLVILPCSRFFWRFLTLPLRKFAGLCKKILEKMK